MLTNHSEHQDISRCNPRKTHLNQVIRKFPKHELTQMDGITLLISS